MTNQDIERIAEEADLWADQELQCIGEYHPDWHEVRDKRFAALIATLEREACVKALEELHVWPIQQEMQIATIEDCIAAIRARSNI